MSASARSAPLRQVPEQQGVCRGVCRILADGATTAHHLCFPVCTCDLAHGDSTCWLMVGVAAFARRHVQWAMSCFKQLNRVQLNRMDH